MLVAIFLLVISTSWTAHADESGECAQKCLIGQKENFDDVRPNGLNQTEFEQQNFDNLCNTSFALLECWEKCEGGEIRDTFFNYTSKVYAEFCNDTDGFSKYAAKEMSLKACVEKAKIYNAVVSVLIYSGGNSSQSPAENLCDMFTAFAAYIEISGARTQCSESDITEILDRAAVAYCFEQLKLGIERSPERCNHLDDVVGAFIREGNSKDAFRQTQPPNQSLDCLQSCLRITTSAKMEEAKKERPHALQKFQLFCNVVSGLYSCWRECPYGLTHDALLSVTNKFYKQVCEAPAGPIIYKGIYDEVEQCGDGRLDAHLPEMIVTSGGNFSATPAENLCSGFNAISIPLLEKANKGCSYAATDFLHDGVAFAYAFLNLKLGIAEIPSKCDYIPKNVINSQLFPNH
jgi:hypothetical protein